VLDDLSEVAHLFEEDVAEEEIRNHFTENFVRKDEGGPDPDVGPCFLSLLKANPGERRVHQQHDLDCHDLQDHFAVDPFLELRR